MPPNKLDLRDVSLVCVETRRLHLARFAIERCLHQADFKEVRLLGARQSLVTRTDRQHARGHDAIEQDVVEHAAIEHVVIPDITSIAEYSDFMVRRLGDYFSGTHALVVQWDGFLTDANSWDPRFLDHDYIGAPWPGQVPAVGNGGFSLRSRRLVDALQSIDTPVTHPEDHAICERYRPQLERDHHVRFAPLEVATRFSWEAVEPAMPTFGFHAFFNFHKALDETELLAYFDLCDDAILHSIAARRLLKNLYRAGMHRAAGKLHALRMQGPARMRLDAIKLRTFARFRSLSGAR